MSKTDTAGEALMDHTETSNRTDANVLLESTPPDLVQASTTEPISPSKPLINHTNAALAANGEESSHVREEAPDPERLKIWQAPEYAEHPEGETIRKQVEYYFSDENLPGDAHMLMKTGGAQNLPVSVKHICGFSRMRKYKPFRAVVESLKKSTFLDVVDNKYLKRKVPFALAPTVEPQNEDESRKEMVQKHSDGTKPTTQTISKTKPWLTKGMLKPTGFEEYYADPPITPAIFTAEREIYDRDISFFSRIETAISRYASKRKFHQNTKYIFDKFMKYGGIDSGPKQFGGGSLNEKELEERNAIDISAINATHRVSEDIVSHEERWAVDFEGVAKGFLSSQMLLTHLTYAMQHEIMATINILRNFYNYILHHDVCPEYTDQINAARKVCNLADNELLNTIFVGRSLPGDFNTAVSRLHGGAFASIFGYGQTWDGAENLGGSEEDSCDIMMAAISARSSGDHDAQSTASAKFEVIHEEDVIAEVVRIEMADTETHARYHAAQEKKPFLKPTGRLHCRKWTYPLARRPTLLPRGRDMQRLGETFTLYLEDDLLEHCSPGMKIEGLIKILDTGILWLDLVYAVSPSFFELLPNEFWNKQKTAKRERAFNDYDDDDQGREQTTH